MGKSKKSKVHGGGGHDLLDSSDIDSMGSSSTALSDLSISYATENVNSEEYVLNKCIDDLYEKRGSTREVALAALVDAFESFILHGLVEDKWAVAVVVRFPDDDPDDSDCYQEGKGVDLLAGVEAIINHLIVKEFKIPAAHAPTVLPLSLSPSVSPRSAAEENVLTLRDPSPPFLAPALEAAVQEFAAI